MTFTSWLPAAYPRLCVYAEEVDAPASHIRGAPVVSGPAWDLSEDRVVPRPLSISRPPRPSPWDTHRLGSGGVFQRRRLYRPRRDQRHRQRGRAARQRRRHLPSRRRSQCIGTVLGLAVADFNSDGKPDLATANSDGHRERAAGQWRRHLPRPQTASPPDTSRRRGGGGLQRRRQARPGRAPTCANDVSVLLGNGDGTFQTQHLRRGSQPASRWRWGISTATASLDLAVANDWQQQRERAAGQRRRHLPGRQRTFAVGGSPDSVAVGDFNGDGKPRPRRRQRSGTQHRERAAGQRRRHLPGRRQTFAVGYRPYSVAVGDFNGDGKPDLAIANGGDSTVSVLLGNGDGTFQASRTFAVGDRTVLRGGGGFQRRRQARPGRGQLSVDDT